MAERDTQWLYPDVAMLLEGLQYDMAGALPFTHRKVRQHEQQRRPYDHSRPRADFQRKRRQQRPEHKAGLVGDLRVRQCLAVSIILEDMRHHHFPRHDALSRQYAADGRKQHQPENTAEDDVQRHRPCANRGAVHLADM